MKRVRKRNSMVVLASQNIEDFLLPGVAEMTKPLFSIPTHHFLFHPGTIDKKDYMDALQLEETEYQLIQACQTGTCLYRCGAERYNWWCGRRNTRRRCMGQEEEDKLWRLFCQF